MYINLFSTLLRKTVQRQPFPLIKGFPVDFPCHPRHLRGFSSSLQFRVVFYIRPWVRPTSTIGAWFRDQVLIDVYIIGPVLEGSILIFPSFSDIYLSFYSIRTRNPFFRVGFLYGPDNRPRPRRSHPPSVSQTPSSGAPSLRPASRPEETPKEPEEQQRTAPPASLPVLWEEECKENEVSRQDLGLEVNPEQLDVPTSLEVGRPRAVHEQLHLEEEVKALDEPSLQPRVAQPNWVHRHERLKGTPFHPSVLCLYIFKNLAEL